VRDRLDRLRDLAGDLSLYIDATLAAYGALVIARGLIWSFVFDQWTRFPNRSGPPPRLDLALDEGIAELVILALVMLVLSATRGHGARLQLATAGVFGIALLPSMFVFDLWTRVFCDQGDFIVHCGAQIDATRVAIWMLTGAIAGAVYVYRDGLDLPILPAIGVTIPWVVVAIQPGYAAMIWRDGIWAYLAMLAPIVGVVAMVVSTLAYRRVRGR
jgi:hypothetical protein